MKKLFVFFLFFVLTINIGFAAEPKILEYNKQNNSLKVEIEGKEYTLDVPVEIMNPPQILQAT